MGQIYLANIEFQVTKWRLDEWNEISFCEIELDWRKFFVQLKPSTWYHSKKLFWMGRKLVRIPYMMIVCRPAHFSRFGFLARCEKKWPISREKLREMREMVIPIFGQFIAWFGQNMSNFQGKITSNQTESTVLCWFINSTIHFLFSKNFCKTLINISSKHFLKALSMMYLKLKCNWW